MLWFVLFRSRLAASGGKPPTVETMELQLIAGKGDIENPPPLPKIVII